MIPGVADARPGVACVLSRVGVGLAWGSPKGLGRQLQTSTSGGPLLHLRICREETNGERDQRRGERKTEGLYSGPTRLEASLGFRESRREIRTGVRVTAVRRT